MTIRSHCSGFYMRYLRPGRIMEVSGIGVALLLLAIIGGGWIAESGAAETFTLECEPADPRSVVYGFVASVLPVWMLLAPRDYLSAFMKIGVIVLLAASICRRGRLSRRRRSPTSPSAAPARCSPVRCSRSCSSRSPAARCRAHALNCSGTTSKMTRRSPRSG